MTAESFETSFTTGAPAGEATAPTDTGPLRGRLRAALEAVGRDLGYETASLFLPTTTKGQWYLAERVGPVRPWHVVLHPGLIETLNEDAAYPNARSMPGVGLRLSGLGCGSVSVFSVEGGARLVLDCAFPKQDAATLRPETSLLRLLAESAGGLSADASKPATNESDLLLRVADAFRRLIEIPGSTLANVLAAVRSIIEADGLAMIAESAEGTIEVHQPPDAGPSAEGPSPLGAILRNLPASDTISDESRRRIAAALDMDASACRAAVCREGGNREVLVASWPDEPRLSADGFLLVARLLGGAAAALDVRADAVEAHLAPARARWAHDIHDGITQSVTAAVIALENLRASIAIDPEAAIEAVEGAQAEIRGSLNELRRIMADLSDSGAVPQRNRPFEELIEDIVQRWRLPARISVEGDVQDIPGHVTSVALLVIREALTNAAKHSDAKHVTVRVMAHPDGLTVVVRDTGRGFDAEAVGHARRGYHYGLGLMRQRVDDVGGTIRISSAPGTGTKVIAFLPVAVREDGPGHQRGD